MEIGDYVIDVDDDDPDLAVVVHRPDVTIAEVTVTYGGNERTVAEDNPEYPTDEIAIVVAFVTSGLNSQWPAWTEAAPVELHERTRANDVPLYTFPESRLTVLRDEERVVQFNETTVDVSALRTRLADAEWQVKFDAGVLVAEKMDERYRIHPTGDIEGEGDIRNPLENLVQQYTEVRS